MYNGILATLLPVEKPLLQDRIEKMNKALQPGIDELKWNSQNIDPFINSAMNIVKEIDELVKKMKDNIAKMQDFMSQWKKPLFERKMKPQPPDELIQFHESLKMPRLEDIKNHGKEIQKLMKDTAENIKPDKRSEEHTLNSSHITISYAVFCLKKKKQKNKKTKTKKRNKKNKNNKGDSK